MMGDTRVGAKVAKPSVGFEHPAKGPHHCSQCQHYQGGSCEVVQGRIAPGDWCRRFKRAVR